jgi:hypothetical protein
MPFNAEEHVMQLQGKDYLEVKWRLVWFRQECPNGTIETEMIKLDLDREVEAEGSVWNNDTRRKEKVIKRAKGYCVFHAVVKDGKGGIGSGTKSETAVDFSEYIEKAESGAIGRALATLGYGTQFTGDELNEHHRIVDSPVEPTPTIGQIYKRGLVTRAWTEKNFYVASSAILGDIPVAKDTVLTAAQLKKLAEAAEQVAVELGVA